MGILTDEQCGAILDAAELDYLRLRGESHRIMERVSQKKPTCGGYTEVELTTRQIREVAREIIFANGDLESIDADWRTGFSPF